MGSLGLPATAMAVRSAFALLYFALLCGLAASSVGQSETETELKEGEAAGNQVLVEQALESRVVRGLGDCGQLKGNKNEYRKCLMAKKECKNNRRAKKNEEINKRMQKEECKNKGGEWKKNK